MIDASALIEYLFRTPAGLHLGSVAADSRSILNVPALCDVEVAAALRRALSLKWASLTRVSQALEAYLDLPLVRHGHPALLGRALELRDNFTVHDAVCVALAERLKATLVTADGRLARAVARTTDLEVVSPG